MAKPLTYTPPAPPYTAAQDEVEDLVRALHESGLLRALAGGARSYPSLLRQLLEVVDADTLRAVIALGGALRDLEPEGAERLASGVRQARSDAGRAARGKPEGPLALARRLRDPDTRRGLSAALAALAAVGRALDGGRRG